MFSILPSSRFPGSFAGLAWGIVGLFALPVMAEPDETSSEWLVLDREAAIRQATEHNLELRAAEWTVRRARARQAWSGRLSPPELEISAASDQWGNNEDESLVEVGLAQRFPLTDRLKREKDLSRVEVAVAEAEIDEARRQLKGAVDRAYLEALEGEEEIKLLTEVRELQDTMVETLETQAAAGTVSSLDVNQAKLSRQQIEKDLQRSAIRLERRLIALKTLLGVPESTRLSLEGNLGLPEIDPPAPGIERAREGRPDFRQHLLLEDRARAELALAETQRWEDVVVRLFAEREASVDEPEGLDRNGFIGVGVSLPLPLKRERVVAEPEAELGQAEANREALSLRIENEIVSARRSRDELLIVARDTADTFVTLAEENLEAIAKAYANGQIELLKYQRAQEQLLQARLSSLEARTAFHLAEAELGKATDSGRGTSPRGGDPSK